MRKRGIYHTTVIDIHSHILSGMDDGSASREESARMLRIASEEAIRAVIVTPHFMPGKGAAVPDDIERGIAVLQDVAQAEEIKMFFYAGCEIFYQSQITDLLDAGRILSLNHTSYILTEFDPVSDRKYILNAVEQIMDNGYFPVIAHAERYPDLMKDRMDILKQIKEMGALIQINSGSVTGSAGRKIQISTWKMLKAGIPDFVATDAHSDRHRAPRMTECAQLLYRKLDEEYADQLLYENAVRYLNISADCVGDDSTEFY